MKIGLAQINPTVGDLETNCNKIVDFHQRAVAAGAELIVFPELSVCGYPPLDLVMRSGFASRCRQALQDLARELQRVPALVGCVVPNEQEGGRSVHNTCALLAKGQVQTLHHKTRLPTYDVFDEDRYFEPATEREVATVSEKRVAVTICEDIWEGPDEDRRLYGVDPVQDLLSQGFDLLVNLSASPFHAGKQKLREELLRSLANRTRTPVVLVNQVGGNDSLLFDGRSLALAPDGRLIGRAAAFSEDLILVDLDATRGDIRPSPPDGAGELFQALIMGLRDYMDKCSFRSLVLGLSGGIDSAVVAVLAAEAAGPENVSVLAMPSGYSSLHSRRDAEQLASNLGLSFDVVPIKKILEAYGSELQPCLGDIAQTLTEENLQARIRGALVMAFANQSGSLALATGNKSELATGYCTLYGDMAGGLAPIGDLLKSQVYDLARYINRNEEIIPLRIIERPPSAELRPDQKDSDSLPPYGEMDPVLDLYVTEGLEPESIIGRGHSAELVNRVINLVEYSEFKRRQAAPVLRVTTRAFGPGRRIPVARGLRRDKRQQ